MSSTANMICRRPSVFGGAIAGSAPTNSGLRNFVSSTRPWPSGVRIMVMSTRTPFEPAESVHPGAFDRHLAFKRHAEDGEEGNGGWEVVDDDADMVHSLDRHVPSLAGAMRANEPT